MKLTDYTNAAQGQEMSTTTLDHEQTSLVEVIKAIVKGLGVDSSRITVLFGCEYTDANPQYDQNAGAVYYNDEVYFVDAFSGNSATLVPVWQTDDSFVGPPVKFGDLVDRDVHQERKLKLELATGGTGIFDVADRDELKTKLQNLLELATQAYVQTQISNLIDGAPGALDTLNELAAAMGDDANFATTITNLLAGKVAKAGDDMTGALAMGTNKITGLGNGTAAQDAVTKSQLDLKVDKAGDTMSGALAMGTNKITGLGNGTAAQDAVTKSQLDLKVNKAGDTMSGALAMGTNKITGLGNGTAAQDAVTKSQLDGKVDTDAITEGSLVLGDFSLGVTAVTTADYEYKIHDKMLFLAFNFNITTNGNVVRFDLPDSILSKAFDTNIFWRNAITANDNTPHDVSFENIVGQDEVRIERGDGSNVSQFLNGVLIGRIQ